VDVRIAVSQKNKQRGDGSTQILIHNVVTLSTTLCKPDAGDYTAENTEQDRLPFWDFSALSMMRMREKWQNLHTAISLSLLHRDVRLFVVFRAVRS